MGEKWKLRGRHEQPGENEEEELAPQSSEGKQQGEHGAASGPRGNGDSREGQ